MKLKTSSFFIILFLCIFGYASIAQQPFDKASFYASIQSKNLDDVNAQLKTIEASSIPEKDAYNGTLLMRKAGLVKGASNKLNLFKKGHKILEASIQKNETNAEFRFLRLVIQENAPGIL